VFQHILVATDGSSVAETAAGREIELAKSLSASVTVLTVIPRFHVLTYHMEVLEDTRQEYARHADARAKQCLDTVRSMAVERGVVCHVQQRHSDDIDDTIIEVAREKGCDAIATSTHGGGASPVRFWAA